MEESQERGLIAGLARALGLSRTAAQLLVRRGLLQAERAQQFLKPRLSMLTPPDSMADRGVASARLAQAIQSQQRICVFGDYDCDGITSAAIMVHALRTLGAQVVVTLANRFEGGYGVSDQAVERIVQLRPQLLVTCDCGSSDAANLRKLGECGIECIVIDHHLVPNEPLPAVAFLNPQRPDCPFSYKSLASCGLALSVIAALRAELKLPLDLHSYLDLVAVGTIADVAPLDGDNRVLVRAGLERMAKAPRPGLRRLFERARLQPGAGITGEDIAFRIAPRLNAPGRMAAPDLALELMLAETDETAEKLADEVELMQQKRRQAQANMFEQACASIEANGWHRDAAIVIGHESWSSGIVGILAGKLTEQYGLPVIALAVQGDVARGSVRAPPKSVPLYDSLVQIADCLLRYGGHQAAAGLDVRVEHLGELRERFNAVCHGYRKLAAAREVVGDRPAVLPVDAADDLMQVARDLQLFEPCGEGNRQPVLMVHGQVARARAVTGGHLQVELTTASGQSLRGFGLNMGTRVDEIGSHVSMAGTLRISSFRGLERAEMRIETLHTAEAATLGLANLSESHAGQK